MERVDVLRAAQRARVKRGEIALWNLGGAGFVVRTASATLLIDPFLGDSNPPDWERAIPPAFAPESLQDVDAVLLTHEHSDHADPVALREVAARTPAVVFGPGSAIEVARQEAALPAVRARVLEHDDAVEVAGTRITAVQAYDPGAKGANGYVAEAEGVTLVHCGDSLYFPGLVTLGERWQIDALCVAIGTNPPGRMFYMDESDAARAARDVGAGMLVPMHFNLWRKTLMDPRRVATVTRWYAPHTRVVPAYLGRRINVRHD